MEKLGLVGLPNAGKSTLYNALTRSETPVAPHPFSTTETVIGDAIVPDERLEVLARLHNSRKLVHAHIQVSDIAGLVSGASTGAGLGNRFLGQIREADGIVYVLRAFEDPNVVGEVDPLGSLETLELELVLADLAGVEGTLERRRKAARADRSLVAEVEALEAAQAALADGVPLYRAALAREHRAQLANAFLLTDKPVLAVINCDESAPRGDPASEAAVADRLGPEAVVLSASLKLEAELASLDPEDRGELLDGLGIERPALDRIAEAAYRALGRRTFFTTGDKETHAWTFRAGANAQTCAGVIHSDLARGFIRAEVIGWKELVEAGSWAKAKALGMLRLEGKEYLVADGDVLEIRFNV